MRAIFLTRVASATVGGLGGAIASVAKTVHSLTVVGPPGIRHFIASLRGFIRGILRFSLFEYQSRGENRKPEAIYTDENIAVYPIPITPTIVADEPSERRHSNLDANKSPRIMKAKTAVGLTADEVRQAAVYHMFKRNSANIRPEVLDDEPIADDSERWVPTWLHGNRLPFFSFPKTFPQSSTLAYVVIGPRPEKPSAKDIPPQPHPVVIILDVPTPDFIPSVLRMFDNECAPFLYTDPHHGGNYKIKAIYHMLGRRVAFDGRYYGFLHGFSSHTKHFISCPELSRDYFTFPLNAWRLYQLTLLDVKTFPFLMRRVTKPQHTSCLVLRSTELMRPGLQIRLDEDAFATGSIVYNFGSPAQTLSSILQIAPLPKQVQAAFSSARRNIFRHPDFQRSEKRISAKVVCLGTGKTIPNQFRNVISTLLVTPDGHIMLDCGEGTAQQLERRYGVETKNMLRDLKCIFISHAHADHHLGLISLLRRRRMLFDRPKQPLYIVATRLVHLFLKEYQDLEDIGLYDDPTQDGIIHILADALNYRHDEYPITGAWRMLGKEPWLDMELSRQHNLDMCEKLNLASFETIDVYHSTRAFGTLIRHKAEWSVTYSGDTRPTINLVKLGYGTDLLIHEASLKKGAEELALKRGHSTITQAIHVGHDMRAKNVLLTHLPPYAVTLPSTHLAKQYENTDDWGGPVVAVANDFMEIDLDKFWKANLCNEAIADCHHIAFQEEKKSIAQLLWELLPEESLVCSPNIAYLFSSPPERKTGKARSENRRVPQARSDVRGARKAWSEDRKAPEALSNVRGVPKTRIKDSRAPKAWSDFREVPKARSEDDRAPKMISKKRVFSNNGIQ
ncbi:hypothetical protein Agabi119p4_11503 [Agaricus bisporus var. burnettii]|uniref:ribonuclease Z n=1 Tax=Agaricus bisporus var. burnettii TaxID=192524 RepID=A0A8H7BZZ9_AGABI|nr:hypothetical protein Agabi119p4_11503 [Agaricus bisporus var. burnettii]